jgi:hypothetical protein
MDHKRRTAVNLSVKSVLVICCLNSVAYACFAQSDVRTGRISGRVADEETKIPLPGASVILPGSGLGASTGPEGQFLIANVPVGSYSIQFRYVGYEVMTQTDIIVRPGRATAVDAELKPSSVQMDQVVVSGGYFRRDDLQSLSTTAFSREEIRRAPGSGGDVSRIILGLPSLAKVNDQSNNLIVRGGSPLENAFYIDNIEVPNINHFPTQGASGGPIGMINVDLIRDVNFRAGGFGASYGDRLSSIMDLTLREGDRTATDGQLSLDFIGFGGVVEGPLFRGKGSYLFSVRRSYLDLIVKSRLFDIGTGVIPRYGDFQGKLVFDITPNHSLEFLSLVGDDHNTPDRATAQEYDMTHFGNQDVVQTTVGLDWRALWSGRTYSNTSLSYTSSAFDEDFYETNTGALFVRNHSVERAWKIRNVSHVKISDAHSLEFGFDVARLVNDYNNLFGAYTDAIGNSVPEFVFTKRLAAVKAGSFIVYCVKPVEKLTATVGLRSDYFSPGERAAVSPRLALSYRIDELTSLNASGGIYYQELPLVLLAQNSAWYSLGALEAAQYVLGIERLLTEDTKLTLEAYQKDYDRFPLDIADPALFLIDEQQYRFGYFEEHGSLSGTGKAESRGIEAIVQKKLAKDVYGLASAAYFRARYRGGDGAWRDRIYDNRFIVSVEGGYKPNNEWEFSARWIYAGGTPFTPLDTAKSRAAGRGVLSENAINQARYPDYHSLNIRFDKRFHFTSSNLVFYLSVWNVYNRRNVAYYFWNAEKNEISSVYQWSILPVFGLDYEF